MLYGGSYALSMMAGASEVAFSEDFTFPIMTWTRTSSSSAASTIR
jgi:hypothetical protein